MKYRKLVIDKTEGIYTGIIQVHKFLQWVTIKTMETDDLEYLHNCMDEILEMLNKQI